MAHPRMIGSIGCFSASPAKFGKKSFTFDGTTLGLIQAAYACGARDGDKIQADYGAGFRTYVLEAVNDPRTEGGIWTR